MSIFDRIFGTSRPDQAQESTASVDVMKLEMDRIKKLGELIRGQQVTMQVNPPTQLIPGQWSYSAVGMGAASSYTPPPPPKVKFVGGDHTWAPWAEVTDANGYVEGIIFKDVFIPNNEFRLIIHALREEWEGMESIQKKMEAVYLEARKRLITE